MVEKVSLSCQCCSGSNLPKSASVHRNPILRPHNLQLGLGTVPKFLLRQFRYLGFDSSSRMILFWCQMFWDQFEQQQEIYWRSRTKRIFSILLLIEIRIFSKFSLLFFPSFAAPSLTQTLHFPLFWSTAIKWSHFWIFSMKLIFTLTKVCECYSSRLYNVKARHWHTYGKWALAHRH